MQRGKWSGGPITTPYAPLNSPAKTKLILDPLNVYADNKDVMATTLKKSPSRRASAQKRAAREAEQVAKVLHSFAATLIALEEVAAARAKPAPTPRNWWRLQAGRFKDDSSFPRFAAQVQAARKEDR
jgi:hypothetical protein